MSTWTNDNDPWLDEPVRKEARCHPCYGTGLDRDGADCLFCDGNGTLEY